MKKIIFFVFALFFLLGSMLLPFGNFSFMNKLPQMYAHCLQEDKNMQVIDFVSDHLLDIDGLFDKHKNGDEQKPHNPIPFQHTVQSPTPALTPFLFELKLELALSNEINIISSDQKNSSQEFFSSIFRPPIA